MYGPCKVISKIVVVYIGGTFSLHPNLMKVTELHSSSTSSRRRSVLGLISSPRKCSPPQWSHNAYVNLQLSTYITQELLFVTLTVCVSCFYPCL